MYSKLFQSIISCFLILCVTALFFLSGSDVLAQEDQAVIITEIMASNSTTVYDEDGDYPDWIELYNRSADTVELKDWGLSDDDDQPFRWVFPDVTIAPGEYLLVWASNKDRRPDATEQSQGIIREVYRDITGTNVDDLLDHPGFPADPDSRSIVTRYFEAPSNIDDNYGQRMHGLLKPPQTGDYVFHIASDDNGRLYLSSDENFRNSELIAEVPGWTESREWDKYGGQQSDEVYLEEGEMYYINALMKEGHGGDNLAVKWELPDGSEESPMPASHIYTVDRALHTNFAISSDGEPVILSKPDGEIAQYIEPVEIPSDVSYGRDESGEEYLFYDNPTPGSANTTRGYSEIISNTPEFSHSGGFYTSGFELSLDTEDPDAEIYYTLDGSEPDTNNLEGRAYEYTNTYPSNSMLTREATTHKYEGPLSIDNRAEESYELAEINTRFSSSNQLPENNIYKGTVVRAKVAKEDAISANSETHTFFVTPEGDSRYDIPVVSIVTDEHHLFNYEKGIYVPGKIADDWYTNNPTEEWNDGRPANYNQRGKEWERPAHFEYFDEDLQPALRQNIGIRIHGGWTRAFRMKSLRLYARNSYDSVNTFHYPFFGDLPARGNQNARVESFRRLIMRNSGNDYHHTMFRDALMQDLVKHLPFSVQAWQPLVHFINGEYWGIINLRERYDEDYLASHYDVDPDNIAMLEAGGDVDQGVSTDRDHFFEILDYAENNDLSERNHLRWVERRVDLKNLAQYYAVQIYFYNTDWPQNNVNFWRKRTDDVYENTPRGHDGRWRWMLYDTDFGMNLFEDDAHTKNGISRVLDESASDPTSRLFRELMQNEDFRHRFINTIADQLNSCFRKDYVEDRIDEFNKIMTPYRDEHSNRWKSGTDKGNSMKVFASGRPRHLTKHTLKQFDLEGTASLTLQREGGGGHVKVNSITINSELPGIPDDNTPYPWEGDYFMGIPVTLKAIDTPGYRFSHWEIEGDDDIAVRETRLTLDGSEKITAVFKEAEQKLIHYWHFNDLTDGELTGLLPDHSLTGETAVIAYEGESEGYMDRVDDGTELNAAGETTGDMALRVRNPADTRELLFSLPTTGYGDIVMKFAVKRTTNGAQVQDIYFQTEEEGAWTSVKENLKIREKYQLIEIDFSEISSWPERDRPWKLKDKVEDNPYFKVKIEFPHETASGTAGNNRFDNVTIEGYPVSDSTASEENGDFFVRVYPVPAVQTLYIEAEHEIRKLSFYNVTGKLVKREKPESKFHTAGVKDLSPGVYLVEIETPAGNVTKRIVVQ
ncbi:MAG: CotH kinase family protein [Bacteroidales bacterium]